MDLKERSTNIRKNILRIANSSKGPHVGTALSSVDILTTLYFKVLKIEDFNDENRDIFIMSKGHGAMALYATLYEKGYLSKEELSSYYQNGGSLPAHLDMTTNPAIEVSSGSLGHGLPQALGFAYSKKLKNLTSKVYVLMGDGEVQEGSVWEAAMLAPKMKLNNLIAIVDRNDLQGYGKPSDLVSFESIEDKFKSFNWNVTRIDGHDFKEIETALNNESDKPKVIICDTTKGKGISFMENELKWHYFIVTDEILQQGLNELEHSL
ncbi:transketolase [Sulfurimonas sp. HSL-1716]|uniref:transketolase n=1 Tax=Hydrocurvibacter sulfurireducens TaxID=3131937 RepID=UPI0031F7659A